MTDKATMPTATRVGTSKLFTNNGDSINITVVEVDMVKPKSSDLPKQKGKHQKPWHDNNRW